MKTRFVLLTISILIVTQAPLIVRHVWSSELMLSHTSYGKITFGTKLEKVEEKLNERATSNDTYVPCMFVRFTTYPNVKFMVENGIITRADTGEGVSNTLGVLVGMPLSEIKDQYPNAIIEPHKYNMYGHYVIFHSHDGKNAIVMETSNGKITDIRGGVEPSVEYVEGCL